MVNTRLRKTSPFSKKKTATFLVSLVNIFRLGNLGFNVVVVFLASIHPEILGLDDL